MLSSDTKKECPEKAATFGHSEISQLHYKKRKEISQMIEATRIKTNDKDGCQVELQPMIISHFIRSHFLMKM